MSNTQGLHNQATDGSRILKAEPKEINQQLDRLDSMSMHLIGLTEKLQPLINQSNPQKQPSDDFPSLCSVADSIARSCSKLEVVVDALRSIEI